MKKSFIELITKWKYTWLGWMVTIYCILMVARFPYGMTATAVFMALAVDAAVLLMSSGRWWGSIIGVIWSFSFYADYLYKWYLINYKNQVIYHNMNLLPLTLIFTAYFMYMGWVCWKENRKKS